MAWEPVKIKEKHWFGEHEFYEAPLIGHKDKTGEIKDNTFQWIGSWTLDASSQYHNEGNGKIGEYKVVDVNTVSEATADDQHAPIVDGQRKEEYCIGLEARWKSGYVSYHQTTEEQLPVGTYALTYDVMNGNSASANASYENRFYVEVNGTRTYDPRTEWMNGGTKWTTHTIIFTLNSAARVKINLGFAMGNGSNNDIEQAYSPALYVSHLKLEQVSSTVDNETHINWSGNFIESINVVKDWTGKEGDDRQCPKTSFYSWLDHKLRFSVDDKSKWYLGRNGKHENVLGLMNMSGNDEQFTIHDLKAGDRFNIEYYRHAVEVNANGTISPSLVSGSVAEVSPGGSIYGADANGLVYYTMSGDGEVTVKIPHNTLIRSITIEHNDYKKAKFTTEPITVDGGKKGYKTTMTDSGVLEEKYGAIPYLTMRYGALSDMTVVRDLGNGEFAASCVINENNNFVPGDDGAKFILPHRNMTEAHLKDWFAGKDWSVFTADLEQNDAGQWVNNQASLLPLYGSYYYFFPEVNGKLKVRFYCEGKNEHMPFWDKTNGGYGLGSKDSDGSNIYEYEGTVSKGHVYYLCSNPNNISHEHNVIRLISYSFVPDFSVEPLYKVVNNTTDIANGSEAITKAAEINGGFTGMNGEITGTYERNKDVIAKVKCLGNVKSAKATIYEEGGKQYLGFSDITFRDGTNANGEAYNHGGAIVAYVDCEYGEASFVLTIAYDAANAKWGIDKTTDNKDARVAATAGGTEVKRWDFFTGKGDYDFNTGKRTSDWELGKYVEDDGTRYDENDDSWKGKSLLYREIHKADGLKADWENTYIDVANSKEPIFKSVYGMEGDNADMIRETAGLVFHTDGGQLGIFNENPSPTDRFQDRYIGLMSGSKLVIPRLQAGDRVVIKMGSFGNADDAVTNKPATLTLTNAKDAKGTDISGDYVIGGSIPYEGETEPHGEYHFKVKETSNSDATDFAIEVKDADLLKIYSIVIYRNAADNNADILTENSITTADGPELLFTDEDAAGSTKDMEFYLRYSGFEEPKTFGDFDNSYTRGNLNLSSSSFTAGSKENSLKVEFTKGDFGSFRADAQVKTKDAGNTYVTDYTPGSLAVGNLDKMKYPYTWDFTDLLEIKYPDEGQEAKYISNAINTEREGSLATDYKGWVYDEGVHCLRNAPMNEPGILFANGGQLYATNEMFNEIAGIGFKRSMDDPEDAKLMNRSVGIHSGSLELNADEGMFHKLVLPNVPANGVVYVRATPIKNASLVTKCSVDGVTEKPFDKTIEIPMGDNKKDYVYIMKNNAERDVELWLNGLSVQKIAVSTDFKKIGSTGYATESRDHIIDHTLTEFFTGLPIKAYYGKLSGDKKSVSLEKVEFLEAAKKEGDATGCILHNETTGSSKSVDVIDGGFHLFVPDMHDNGSSAINGNVLLAHLGSDNIQSTSDVTRYVLANQWYSPTTGEPLNTDPTVVRFVKVDHNTGAKLSANSAYMELSKDAGAKIANIMLFYDESQEPSGETTGIVTVNHENEKKNVWYNLSGLPVETPSNAGIYIRNGKKVVVK